MPTMSPCFFKPATSVTLIFFEGSASDRTILSLADPSKKIKVTDVAGLKKQGLIVGIGYRGPNPANRAINPFAAQFCEVEVNIKTGEVRILRFLSANDSGRVMNRLTLSLIHISEPTR